MSYIRRRMTDKPTKHDRTRVWSARHDSENMRRLCIAGTEAYARALLAAGYVVEDHHLHAEGSPDAEAA